MIILNFDLNAGTAKLSATTTVVLNSAVPVQVIFSAAPDNLTALQVALGDSATPPNTLAYMDLGSPNGFTKYNDTTWAGALDLTDSRLTNPSSPTGFMVGKGPTAVNLEVAVVIDGVRQVAPHLSITIQPNIIAPPSGSSEGGPTYYTEAQVDGFLAAKAALTVAGKYRILPDGTFQLWNSTQSKWHTLTVSGAVGAEVLQIGAGQL